MGDEDVRGVSGPVFVSAEAVTQSVDLPNVIAALRRTYEAQPPTSGGAGRTVARGTSGARVRALAAVLPDGEILGTKVHVQPTAAGSRYLISLFSQGDGALLALLDGQAITELRTGATSALALDALAPQGALDIAVLGSGTEARSHLRAIAALRPLHHVAVFSPTPERRELFAAEMAAELSVEISACSTAEEAVGRASTVLAAARSHGEVPIFKPDALNGATTVVSVGSTLPEQRELHESVLARAALIVADEPRELLEQSGDCIAAAAAGIELAGKAYSLAQLIQQALPVPIDHAGINVFKSVGSALQDVAVASLIFQTATAAGRFTPLPILLSSKEKRG
ncbi:MAG TPA: ornithine cyclodeaminase family protein [Solirubrobacteraceae bacterium]|jgi:ornithine cyclodeaminase/alanine dehydrogenase|nr:ornithine cyclodeaminase family protein [Solirubrobacteraceae bacterium]